MDTTVEMITHIFRPTRDSEVWVEVYCLTKSQKEPLMYQYGSSDLQESQLGDIEGLVELKAPIERKKNQTLWLSPKDGGLHLLTNGTDFSQSREPVLDERALNELLTPDSGKN